MSKTVRPKGKVSSHFEIATERKQTRAGAREVMTSSDHNPNQSQSTNKEFQNKKKTFFGIMPRGKNYVNNNKGVSLQASANSKAAMQMCEYGSGCSRSDCIYRHPDNNSTSKTDEICMPFLAGNCTFAAKGGCRKRHPKKEERARLLQKYKRTRCRFGDECFTESCLYLHPREVDPVEPYYVEHHDVAFPPLNGSQAPSPSSVLPSNSPWKGAPSVPLPQQIPPVQAWYPAATHQGSMAMQYYGQHMDMAYSDGLEGYPKENFGNSSSFNANAKEFIPGGNFATN